MGILIETLKRKKRKIKDRKKNKRTKV